MRAHRLFLTLLCTLFFVTAYLLTRPSTASILNAEAASVHKRLTIHPSLKINTDEYPIGTPTVTDLWVDPINGHDDASGVDRDQALRTITAAWQRIPRGGTFTTTGYRIQLVAGDYPESNFPEYWEDRHGTAQFPIIVQAADGPRTARLQADLNMYNVSYLYLLDLTIQHTSDVFHCERCDHLLIRNSALLGTRTAAHENVKINQSQYIYLEHNDIDSAEQNAVDFVAVQYGHILYNRIHNADDWCMYLKGGSAHFRIEGNEIYDCGTGGVTAGEGSGFEYMVAPWLHYEAYDLKIVNNVIHDTDGAGLGVNGGYDILLAYNTLYRVGARSHVLEFVFGGRTCDGDGTLAGRCAQHLAAGGWGTATVGASEPIPNRNIYVYNNLIYNPAGYHSQWQHLAIYGPRPTSATSNMATPAHSDDHLVIRGNVIWNGPADHALGLGEDSGCQPSNLTCNATQLLADNAINTIEPQLVDPEHGDYRPVLNSNLSDVTTDVLPAFPAWATFTPTVPAGELANHVLVDRNGVSRPLPALPGAYVAGDATPGTTGTPTVTQTLLPTTPSGTPTATQTLLPTTPSGTATSGSSTVGLYLPAIANGSAPVQPTLATTPTPALSATAPVATMTPTASPGQTITSTPTTEPTTTATATPTPVGTQAATLPAGPVTLVMLGDSLTAGQGDDAIAGGGYPRRLLERIQSQRPGSTATNLGQSGWTASDLIQGVNGEPAQLSAAVAQLTGATGAKVALLWIGSNDLWYLYEFGNPDPSAEDQDLQRYTADIDTLLSQLSATGATLLIGLLDDQSQRPVVADPPNPSEPAFPSISAAERQQMSQQVNAYNNTLRSKASQYGALVVDFYDTSIFTTPATLADDGNHPNAAGYDAITELWFARVNTLLAP